MYLDDGANFIYDNPSAYERITIDVYRICFKRKKKLNKTGFSDTFFCYFNKFMV